jgi:hypothetical protein
MLGGGLEEKSWPGRILLIRPSRSAAEASPPRHWDASPAGEWSREPSRGEEPAQPGLVCRPSRETTDRPSWVAGGMEAQLGTAVLAHAGEGHRPATEGTDRPSRTSTMPAQLLYMSAWAWLIRSGSIYSSLELLFTCFLIFLHI